MRQRIYQSNAEKQRAYRERKRNTTTANVTPYYQDEHCTLYHGDCIDLLKRNAIATNVTLTFTDPPYNVKKEYDGYSDNLSPEEYKAWCRAWYSLVPKPLVFTPGKVNIAMWYSIEVPAWIASWRKSNQCSRNRFGGADAWEPLLVYGKLRRLAVDCWDIPISTQQRDAGDHPVPKYLPAWKRILSDMVMPNDVIFDPFAGSGTTLLAVKTLIVQESLNLHCIGIEQSRTYCDLIVERLSKPTQEKMLLTAA